MYVLLFILAKWCWAIKTWAPNPTSQSPTPKATWSTKEPLKVMTSKQETNEDSDSQLALEWSIEVGDSLLTSLKENNFHRHFDQTL